VLGSGPLSVRSGDHELLRLCAIVAADLDRQDLIDDFLPNADVPRGYYETPTEWFSQPLSRAIPFEEKFVHLKENIEDFATYFKQLCRLHKRRLKFALILERQAFAQIEQIVPRSLLEYGLKPSDALASWLIWRKWFYDVDNRSAQETGYLFEPILAAAIGGVPFSAAASPVKRADTSMRGRQVDCIDGTQAYEFKMRVTLAAKHVAITLAWVAPEGIGCKSMPLFWLRA